MKIPNTLTKQLQQGYKQHDFGDPRRNIRIEKTLGKLCSAPNKSLPEAMGSETQLEGAYRLINNPHINFELLGRAHVQETIRCSIESGSVLVIHDTTTCQISHADAKEIGYLPTGKAGFYFHASLVIDAYQWRKCFGVIHGETLHRPQRSGRGGRKCKASGSEVAKWKDRESERWFRGILESNQRLQKCDAVIHVADREGDSYELLANMVQGHMRFVVRVKYNNRIARNADGDDAQWTCVQDVLAKVEGIFEREVELSARKTKSAPRANQSHPPRLMRIARLQFSATSIVLRSPSYIKHLPSSIKINVVHVTELDVPEGEVPVDWFIYTTEPITCQKEVERIVDIYRARWTIEEFFHALKTGCIYEKRQFESRSALLNVLALLLPIACMMLWIRSQARTNSNAPANAFFSIAQLRILHALYPNKVSSKPTIGQVFILIAAMGGHKKSNGPPGFKILYRGLTKLMNYEEGWKIARNYK